MVINRSCSALHGGPLGAFLGFLGVDSLWLLGGTAIVRHLIRLELLFKVFAGQLVTERAVRRHPFLVRLLLLHLLLFLLGCDMPGRLFLAFVLLCVLRIGGSCISA